MTPPSPTLTTAFTLTGAVALLVAACTPPPPPLAPLDTSDIIVQNAPTHGQAFGIDVFIDATPSMEGYVLGADSAYSEFLEDLEGSLVSAVRNVSDIRYFKFGETVREISRQQFRDARDSDFYHEPGVFRDTNLQLVLARRTLAPASSAAPGVSTAGAPAAPLAPRLTVVVTDLFQKDQDVNIVVSQVKDGCLSRPDCSVAVLPIASAFNGTVFDARVPSYPYRSTSDPATHRPFYLLMFGPEEQLMQFGDVLSVNRYIDLARLLVIGPRIVKSFSVAVTRDPAAQGVTLDSAFNLRRGFAEGRVACRVEVTGDTRTFGYEPSRLELRAWRRDGARDTPATEEVLLDSIAQSTTGAMDLRLTLRPPATKGDYIYVAELVLGGVNGFVVPRWVSELSSSNPSPEHDPAKTLNLDNLVERLIAASLLQDHHLPTIARFRILVHKL